MTTEFARIASRLGFAVVIAASLLQVWMNFAVGIVGSEDNAQNQGFFLVVATAWACAFTARFRAEGMACAMLATAGMQALLAAAVATAPMTARVEPMGAAGVLLLSSLFVALWLAAAALFHAAAQRETHRAAA